MFFFFINLKVILFNRIRNYYIHLAVVFKINPAYRNPFHSTNKWFVSWLYLAVFVHC